MDNGKSGAKLDLTSSTTPGLQIHKFDHSRTANPCDWLLCCRAALPLVGCPHSIVYLHLPVVEGLIFCISATPHLGTSFPLFHELIIHIINCRKRKSYTPYFCHMNNLLFTLSFLQRSMVSMFLKSSILLMSDLSGQMSVSSGSPSPSLSF